MSAQVKNFAETITWATNHKKEYSAESSQGLNIGVIIFGLVVFGFFAWWFLSFFFSSSPEAEGEVQEGEEAEEEGETIVTDSKPKQT